MKQIETEILIDAAPEAVWKVLTDFENHPLWNPFIQSIEGEKAVGKTLVVSIKPPDGNGMTFSPEVLVFEPYREFRWRGKLGIKGIFDGEHYFLLSRADENKTHFIHGEAFSGVLVWMMGKTLEKTREGFILMNKALKAESEKRVIVDVQP